MWLKKKQEKKRNTCKLLKINGEFNRQQQKRTAKGLKKTTTFFLKIVK